MRSAVGTLARARGRPPWVHQGYISPRASLRVRQDYGAATRQRDEAGGLHRPNHSRVARAVVWAPPSQLNAPGSSTKKTRIATTSQRYDAAADPSASSTQLSGGNRRR